MAVSGPVRASIQGPDPGSDPGSSSSDPGSDPSISDPSISDLRYILQNPVKRPYEPI